MLIIKSGMVSKTNHHRRLSHLLFEVADGVLISIREEVEDLVFDVILF